MRQLAGTESAGTISEVVDRAAENPIGTGLPGVENRPAKTTSGSAPRFRRVVRPGESAIPRSGAG